VPEAAPAVHRGGGRRLALRAGGPGAARRARLRLARGDLGARRMAPAVRRSSRRRRRRSSGR
jgi:hypothetical protein